MAIGFQTPGGSLSPPPPLAKVAKYGKRARNKLGIVASVYDPFNIKKFTPIILGWEDAGLFGGYNQPVIR